MNQSISQQSIEDNTTMKRVATVVLALVGIAVGLIVAVSIIT